MSYNKPYIKLVSNCEMLKHFFPIKPDKYHKTNSNNSKNKNILKIVQRPEYAGISSSSIFLAKVLCVYNYLKVNYNNIKKNENNINRYCLNIPVFLTVFF